MAKASIGKKVLKLGYVGAGGINFGTPEGPWNHAAKLEKFDGEQFSIRPFPSLVIKYDIHVGHLSLIFVSSLCSVAAKSVSGFYPPGFPLALGFSISAMQTWSFLP